MDVATGGGGTLAAEGVKSAFQIFWKQVSYVINYKGNLQDLNSRIAALTDSRARLQIRVEAAQNRLEEVYEDVEIWLKLVDDEIVKAKAILDEDEKAKKSCCVGGLVPNIKARHKYSRRAKKEAPMVEALKDKDGFVEVGYVVPPAGIVPSRGYEAFESRAGVFRAVVQSLNEADVVGVWGLGGVGKTTLAKKVAERVKVEGMFTVVAMATIGQNLNLYTIQREIAEWLGFKLEETTGVRAAQLLKRLKQEKSNILIVLDDIWKKVDLDAIGVPSGGDRTFCKILLTSRSRQVLADMGASVNHCFPIRVLTKEEGLVFFQKNVGEMQDSVFQDLANEIVVRCGGLPVLILPIANALKNKDLREWKDALEELKKGDFEENAFPLLELSYKFLKEDEKSLFLLCGQVGPKDISFSKLFMYSIGLGFFRNYDTLENAKNRLHKLVNHLKRSSLLENDNNNDETVQMHDVVHSFAISKEHSFIAVARYGQLTEWPTRDVHGYFMNPPQILHCPRVKVLILANKDLSRITQNFFSETKELRVLDLQAIRFPHLPSSFGFLMNLETLCLHNCYKLEDISFIGDLEKLQVLCLSGSDLVYLPSACGRLTRLRLLDLSNCYKLEMIAPNVLSCLTLLEELLMDGCHFLRWEFQDENSGRSTANLNELKSMPKLHRVEIALNYADIIPNNLFSTKLEVFKIIFGDGGWQNDDDKNNRADAASRSLKLICLQTNYWPMKEVSAVVKRTEGLYMEMLSGFADDICKLDMEGFLALKRLSIRKNHDIRYVINTTERGYPTLIFPILESLRIRDLPHMERMCHGLLTEGSLGRLRELRLEGCCALKNLFSVSILRTLTRLQEIEIVDCPIMTVIAVEDGKYNSLGGKKTVELPQLHNLCLRDLPQLTSICSSQNLASSSLRSQDIASDNNVESSSGSFFFNKVAFPNLECLTLDSIGAQKIWDNRFFKSYSATGNLTRLCVARCSNLTYLLPSSMVESLNQLRELDLSYCESMKEIILSEDNVEKVTMVFPKLESLRLYGLGSLLTICTSCELLEFPSLKLLHIGSCSQLKTFVKGEPSTTTSAFFDHKVAFPNLECLTLDSIGAQKIWDNRFFKSYSATGNLTRLCVARCSNLTYLLPSSMVESLNQLRELDISYCGSMKEIILSEDNVEKVTMVFPKLESLKLYDLGKLLTICTSCELLEFPSLKLLHIEDCSQLKTFVKGEPSTTTSALFDHKVLFPKLENLEISDVEDMEMIWHEQLHVESFGKLKKLIIYRAAALRRIFPSSMLRKIQNLNTVVIFSCHSVEEVFDSHILVNDDQPAVVTELKTIYLGYLEKLKHIWHAGLKGIVSFQNLTSVKVHDCEQLKSIFPASMCVELFQLEIFEIYKCGMEHIIAVEEGFQLSGTDMFEFPCLNSVELRNNSTLRGFYPEKSFIYLPALENVYVAFCPMFEMEDTEEMSREEAKAEPELM